MNPMPSEEEQLVEMAKAGDETAFTRLFQLHYPFLYKYIVKMAMDEGLADDLIQETMLKAYLHIKDYNGASKYSSWLITIATRTYIDYVRKRKRERGLFQRLADEAGDMLKWRVQQTYPDNAAAIEVIGKLDPMYRIPLLLKHYYGYSYKEIADMLHVKEGTVKSRVNKSVLLVRKGMDENGE